jgi:ABC-2 type transport system ATP-binding protein
VIADDTPAALKARLGSTVIESGLADEQAAARAAGLLARRGTAPERDGSHVRLTSSDGSAVLIGAMHDLDSGGLRPAGVQVREPSLDDVFLLLTGHHAEEDAQMGGSQPAARGAA